MNACRICGSEPWPTALSKNNLTRSGESSGLTSRPLFVPGTQLVAAEVAVVPPTNSVLSIKTTFAPSMLAFKAAENPAAPVPTTMRSTFSSV